METSNDHRTDAGPCPFNIVSAGDNGPLSSMVTSSETEVLDLSNFTKLPAELRQRIWKLLIKTRLVQLKLHYIPSSKFHGPYSMDFYCTHLLQRRSIDGYIGRMGPFSKDDVCIRSPSPLPIISKICKESRIVFESQYYPWMTGEKDRKIWINGAVDRVFIHDMDCWIPMGFSKLNDFFQQRSQQIAPTSVGVTRRSEVAVTTRSSSDVLHSDIELFKSPAVKRSREIKSLVLPHSKIQYLLLSHLFVKHQLLTADPTLHQIEARVLANAKYGGPWFDWFAACTEIILIQGKHPDMSRNACLVLPERIKWERHRSWLGSVLSIFSSCEGFNKWDRLKHDGSCLGYPSLHRAGREYDRLRFGLASLAEGDEYGEGGDSDLMIEGPVNEDPRMREWMGRQGWTEENGFRDQ